MIAIVRNEMKMYISVMSKVQIPASLWLLCTFYSAGCLLLLQQVVVVAVTDPKEVAAIRSITQKWTIDSPETWNSTDPCSGFAISSVKIDDVNPGIKCDCTGDTCHVTEMKVYAKDITGEIPEELATLTYLSNLNLNQNYLTGPIPAFLGKLVRMQYLALGTNNLSGPVPKELGNLSKLIVLSVGSNSHNGTLPSELGNLTQLEQLYINSAGVSGEIPSTFRNLQKLQKLWASDNQFTGEIPDFIGSWTDLTTLRLQGTALKGPIPSSFSNLTSLSDLRISDLTSGSSVSSLTFLNNLKKLTILVLRNNMISGEIPSYIGELSQLTFLDLSFNNFTGEFASSFQSLSSLQFLFLGNNNLSGKLPSQQSSSLEYLDLSYNRYSGALPTWLNAPNLKVNLVGNYLKVNEMENGLASRRLDCLQRTFPCYRESPRYSRFAINCGGQRKTFSEVVFERDNETLDAASFYVSDTQKWGVSNTGSFMDSSGPNYTKTTQSQIANTLDSELFQTARQSPSSLRYYGLGLENGPYTVKLQFAEIDFEDGKTWKSLGHRIFDVYVQGNKKLTNFDIRKEAGSSNRAVVRSLKTNVTENFLEIHFFWTGKGSCCITTQGTYGPLVSAISVTPDFIPTVTDEPPSNMPRKKIKRKAVIGIVISVMVTFFICLALIIFYGRRFWKASEIEGEEHEAIRGIHAKPNIFSYADMKTATRDFNEENKLGQGGFGTVYRGILPDGKVVAVKQLSAESKQGKREFINEVAAISAVQHRNLVKLHGCCLEGNHRLLVYEYLENNSIAQALFGNLNSSVEFSWPTRFNICIGTARGLAYLHEESSIRIVHRDIKASNILLDNSLNPKIADFGLAKLFDDTKTHISTRVAGTVGYLAPEYAMRGHLTEKADVFSFGVVSLEVVSGRSNMESSFPQDKVYLLEWAWNLHEQNQLLQLMDPRLKSTYSEEEVLRVIAVALLCTQALPSMRPSMSRVVAMLTSDVEEIPPATRPGYITDWQYTNHLAAQDSRSTTNVPSTLLTASMIHSAIGDGR